MLQRFVELFINEVSRNGEKSKWKTVIFMKCISKSCQVSLFAYRLLVKASKGVMLIILLSCVLFVPSDFGAEQIFIDMLKSTESNCLVNSVVMGFLPTTS
jgi:hypothetical protein